ncbi:AI-2E family transporter [Tunturiibacter gelidiferens]|uniref:AI-2E family transporter n=1 Tax=Tunturiibacter gelidiferens TaxID=3069689 RepID=UPI003D9BE307
MRFLRPIGTVGVVIVFTIYLLMKREDLRHRILLLAGMGRINLMTQALQEAATRISQYLLFQTAVNAAYGFLFGSGLYLIGVPNATLWGVLAGILRIVPYVGTATSLALPLIVSVAISTTWWPPILILCLFLALELTATNFVEPWLYSTRTGISSLALLAMAIFWALLWGWPGLILSTPSPSASSSWADTSRRCPSSTPSSAPTPSSPPKPSSTSDSSPWISAKPAPSPTASSKASHSSSSTTPSSSPPSPSSSRSATRATSTTSAPTSSSSPSAKSSPN